MNEEQKYLIINEFNDLVIGKRNGHYIYVSDVMKEWNAIQELKNKMAKKAEEKILEGSSKMEPTGFLKQ